MFNNRQSRRRFRLGNLAKLVQLRQSVSNEPPPPRRTLEETLSQSSPGSPPFQPQPPSFPSPIPSTSTLPLSFLESGEDSGSPPHVPPEPKSSPLSPLSPKSKEEPRSQLRPPLMSKLVNTHRNLLIQSPPMSPPESAESQPSVPPPTLTPEAKTLVSPLSTLKATGESQPSVPPQTIALEAKTLMSPPSTLKDTGEPQQSVLSPTLTPKAKTLVFPPSTLKATGESQQSVPPPTLTPEAKTLLSPPSTLTATGESQSKLPPPLPSVKNIDETRFRSPLPRQGSSPSLPVFGESHMSLPPPKLEGPPSSPLTLNVNEESQSQPPPPLPSVKYTDETRFRSPLPPQASSLSLSESDETHISSPPPKTKTPPSSPLTFDANEAFQSQTSPPLPPSTSIDETGFRPSQEAKTLPSSPAILNGNEVFKSQTSPPLPPSKFIDETQFQSSPPPLSPPKAKIQSTTLNATEGFQSQPPLPPPKAKTPPSSPSTLNGNEVFKSPPPLLPSKSIDETHFRSSPPSLSDTGETQPLLLPPERKTPSPPSTQNSTGGPQSQPLTPSKSIKDTQFRSPPRSYGSPPSLSESGESQLPLPQPEAKTPPSTQNATQPRFRSPLLWQASPQSLSKSDESQPPPVVKTPPSMLKANEGFQSQTSPPPLSFKTQFRSLPPSLSESDESQPPLPPPEAKTPPSPSSTLNAIGESQSQTPPPFKSTDETRFQSPASSQTSLPNSVEPQSSLQPSEAKNLPTSPSMLTANEDFRSETSPPRDGTRSHSPPISPPSKNTEKPKSISPLLSLKAAENLRSQSPIPPPSLTALTSPSPMKTPIPSPAATITSPPSLSSPLKPQIIPPPEPSLPKTKPNQIESSSPKLSNTEAHTSPDHKKDVNYNPDKVNAKLTKKTPTWNKEAERGNRGKAIWTEKKTEPMMMMMFINSNVQGFNTSLAFDSSSIDHEPGVHLTIDSDQSCDFSSKVF